MSKIPIRLLENWNRYDAESELDVAGVEKVLGYKLPEDYIEFLRSTGSGEGEVGDGFIMIWSLADLLHNNREYEVDVYAPGLLLFGSNGGGEAYAYDTRSTPKRIIEVPFIGLSLDEAEIVADDIAGLFEYISDSI